VSACMLSAIKLTAGWGASQPTQLKGTDDRPTCINVIWCIKEGLERTDFSCKVEQTHEL
jgi:hypothetical protein